MHLFKIDSQKLLPLKEVQFDLEKHIQKLTEANLETVFGLELVKHEFGLENFAIDTLAFDPRTKAFVIIEYKKKPNFSIMDQGGAYRTTLLNHTADVIVEYYNQKNKFLKKGEVNWDETQVMFIAPEFTPHQKAAINTESTFQLWEVRMYADNLISYNQISPKLQHPTSMDSAEKQSKVIRDDVISKWSDFQKNALRIIEERVFQLGSNIKEKAHKTSISFETKKSFLQVWFSKDKDSLTINFVEGSRFVDDKKLLQGTGKLGRYIKIKSQEQISEIGEYIKQAYENASK